MKTLKLIGAIVGGLAVLFFVVALVLPDKVHVERSVIINKPADQVFPYLADFNQFVKWNPWSSLDPNQKTEISNPSSGVGAKYSWAGNDEVGVGSLVVAKEEVNKSIEQTLTFTAPWQSVSTAKYTLEPAEGGTKVVWSYDGEASPFPIGRYMGTMMDGMLGPQYDKGLQALKALAEAAPEQPKGETPKEEVKK